MNVIDLEQKDSDEKGAIFKPNLRKDRAAGRLEQRRREEGRMWVFIRPRGGQKCYLLGCEIRRCAKLCPIHRFDGLDQVPSEQI